MILEILFEKRLQEYQTIKETNKQQQHKERKREPQSNFIEKIWGIYSV